MRKVFCIAIYLKKLIVNIRVDGPTEELHMIKQKRPPSSVKPFEWYAFYFCKQMSLAVASCI